MGWQSLRSADDERDGAFDRVALPDEFGGLQQECRPAPLRARTTHRLHSENGPESLPPLRAELPQRKDPAELTGTWTQAAKERH